MKLQSAMTHQFSQVPSADIPRSSFNRTHGHKTTFDAGYLVPIYVDEALPGDTFKMRMTAFARLATPIFPIMDNVYLDTFFFAVPVRLLFTNWEKLNGAQTNPGDSTDYAMPTITSPVGGWAVNSLQDYLGLPTVGQVGAGNTITSSAIFTRAYNKIYNDWFRDENLQNSVTVDTGAGPDTAANYTLLRRGKRHDYFTSCLPWAQKSTPVSIGAGGFADVWGSASALPTALGNNNKAPIIATYVDRATDANFQASMAVMLATSRAPGATSAVNGANGDRDAIGWRNGTNGGGGVGNTATENASDLVFLNKTLSQTFRPTATAPFQVDLTSASGLNVNDLRRVFQIQKLYERDARGGTRMVEVIRAHFGVISPDFRLGRAEFLGGGSAPINLTPIAKTSTSDATSPQGSLAAIGTAVANNHGFLASFTEHMVVMGLACVRADLTYQQGLERQFSRSTRWDFYWPALSHIGEQEVYNREIYADGSANDTGIFGYQARYDEYRYKPSRISGKFKSTSSGNIDEWHLAQQFGSLPALNASFIVEQPPMSRVLAATAYTNDILFDSHFDLRCVRPMPLYGVPGLIDHF